MQTLGERKHSKYSASAAERWTECPGSVELSEGLPDKSSPWALEGTQAHAVLEALLKMAIANEVKTLGATYRQFFKHPTPREMVDHGLEAANAILKIHAALPLSELHVESRVYLDFIDFEMFGTYDAAIADPGKTLHVFDYKYGAGHAVSPKKNLQMIFYALGVANKFFWKFKKVKMWIIQPRITGYKDPVFWEISMDELKRYIDIFDAAVYRVEKFPDTYSEGAHCHWCKAKSICPLKKDSKMIKMIEKFVA